MLDFTHDPKASSWVPSTQAAGGDFPIQNLPFGVFSVGPADARRRGGIAIGDEVIDLARLDATGLLAGAAGTACRLAARETLNDFMAMGPGGWRALRQAVFGLLRHDVATATREQVGACLMRQDQVQMQLPATIGDYTDFFTSLHHAVNAGRLVRPDDPLVPNFKWMPVAYHGRSSSVVTSGTAFHRPHGQARAAAAAAPTQGPCQRLDFELEMGFYVGPPTQLGQPIPVGRASEHIFGMCLLNDWSARDIQVWEMNPLGPFLAKNFCTTVAPWIVTLDALQPFRTPQRRETDDPPALPYLADAREQQAGGYDVHLEVMLQTALQRARGLPGERITATSLRHQYWTVAQMLAHHTVNGCPVRSGDLVGTGTISGPTQQEAGSMMELTLGGRQPLRLAATGESRAFLEDGDSVVLRGHCEAAGAARIGFGECRGQVLAALN
jgi:fumarylacetoacetase